LFIGILGINSCKDDYFYDEQEPNWLGASIYDYLNSNGNYSIFVKLINDVGYKDVLAKTGSKTLFVANDSAFMRFFQNNPWGVSSYDQMSLAQKKLILNYSMINNAYLIETLCNYNDGGSLITGQAMRRITAISVFDSVPFDKGDALPKGSFWAPYKEKGIHLLKDNTSWPLVHFLQKQLDYNSITDDDFQLITGVTRSKNDAHVFDDKVIKRDIVCKNGYIDVLQNVLVPRTNMADFIHNNPKTSVFSSLLDRFCAPYYSPEATKTMKELHPDFSDSVFVKKYYTTIFGGGAYYYPDERLINNTLLLTFDPGWNSYHYMASNANVSLQADMAAMFVPTDDALYDYFNTGKGKLLKDRYQTWDNIPDDVVILLLKRHMRKSFIESVPSRFPKLKDDENYDVNISKSDIESTYVGVNGVVYLTKNVYPPADYESVYAPVLFSEHTKVFNWGVIQNSFRLYLNALQSRFSFFVPTDEYLTNYIDPITIGKDIPGALKYWYNSKTGTVNATVYKYDVANNVLGDSVDVITSSSFIKDRLLDLLDSHIVVGDVESGRKYYLTKGGSVIRATGNGLNLTVEGGGDIDRKQKANVTVVYPQTNGNTYFIDKPIQTPLRSVYKVLSTTPEFSAFFELLNGFSAATDTSPCIFVKKANYYGIDYNVKFFNTYNYSVYVPTNAAIQKAIADGIISPWESQNGIVGINDMMDVNQQYAATKKLERFLRYHFQDNAVFISGNSINEIYPSATIKNDEDNSYFNTYKNKYYKIGITGSGNGLTLTTETGATVNVVTDNGFYNIITRDYIFSDSPSKYKEIDGSGSGNLYNTSQITTSSTAVIHQIDNVLIYK
jgi:uncharacterized surface protein with fasciclin (FAS1) repeats